MANFAVWNFIGGFIGWLASLVMRTNAQQGTLLNIVVGVVGACLAGLVATPLLGTSLIPAHGFNVAAVLVPLVGAVVLVGVVSIFRRGVVALR